jgi:hypothetical protein
VTPRRAQGVFGNSSSGRKWSIGVSCKSQSTAIPVGIASICNAADHFKRPFYGWRGLCEHALAGGLDGGAIKRHLSLDTTLALVGAVARLNWQCWLDASDGLITLKEAKNVNLRYADFDVNGFMDRLDYDQVKLHPCQLPCVYNNF